MPIQSMPEKLLLKDEKNLLLQGLPSSLEKQFMKIPFARQITPLLKSRKVEFALVFAVSQKQLKQILHDVIPALHKDAKLWVAYPKLASKIASDLSRDANWGCIADNGYETARVVALDSVWSAVWLKKPDAAVKKEVSFSSEKLTAGKKKFNDK